MVMLCVHELNAMTAANIFIYIETSVVLNIFLYLKKNRIFTNCWMTVHKFFIRIANTQPSLNIRIKLLLFFFQFCNN